MTFDSPSLLRRLQELQQQIAETPRYGAALDAACDGFDRHEALCATIDAKRHVRALAMTTSRIKAMVVPADGLGAALESLSELVLRAVRRVVLAELGTLRDLVRERSEHGGSGTPSWGRFWGVEDLTVCVYAELDQITDQWRGYRGMAGIARDAYRAALRAAHASVRRLGGDSEFARFLREQPTGSDWPELQAVRARMRLALTIRIDADPDLPLLVFAGRLDELAAERAS